MSQFAFDDFTVELKNFFIQSTTESLKNVSTLPPDERKNLFKAISADALSNEFTFLSQWIHDQLIQVESEDILFQHLNLLSGYLQELSSDLIDSELRSKKFQPIQTSKNGHYLHFRYLADDYLAPVQFVLEVVGNSPVFKLPVAQPGIFGLIIFRGEPIPVVDLFDQKLECQNYLICQNSAKVFALPISHALQVYEFDHRVLSQVQPLKNLMASEKVVGILSWQEQNMIILDLEKVGAE